MHICIRAFISTPTTSVSYKIVSVVFTVSTSSNHCKSKTITVYTPPTVHTYTHTHANKYKTH